MTYPNLLDRFLTYVKVNTRSDEHSTTTPSTQSQVDFATNVPMLAFTYR
ncbi:peptidase T [Streptococcus pneumoniae]|nr:peptidase T [Streptococcus pneumoniae]CIV98744.1 peptidase T [Streptococcus pneumoniae]